MLPTDPEPPESAAHAENDLGLLCPSCAFSNVPEVDFCARCRAPLSMMSTIDPLRSTLAEGFAYRRAVDGTSKPIVLVGIWLIFLPTMAVPVLQAINDAHRTLPQLGWVTLLGVLSVAVLYRSTASFLRKRREARDAATDGETFGAN